MAQEGKSNNGFEIKRFKLALQNKDIIVTDFSYAKRKKKNRTYFEKNIVAQTFSVHQIINECSLFDIVNVSVLVFNLQE